MSRARKKKSFRTLYTKDPTGLEFRWDFIRPRGSRATATHPLKDDQLQEMWGHWHRDSIELDDERQMISLYFEDERDFVLASLTIPAE